MTTTQQRFKFYLILILLTGVGLALAVPALVHAHASTRGEQQPVFSTGTIIYVDQNNTSGITNGETWATAYTDLQDALSDGDAVSGNQIWVAAGVYTPGTNRADSFNLVPGVVLYGGFRPDWGDDQFEERDWVFNRTILSGDIGEDDYTTYAGLVLTSTDIVGDNSYHVVAVDGTGTPVTSTTLLDGFYITAGQANGGAVPDNRGGGYYCDGSGGECSPALRNIEFSGNYAHYGGGLYNNGYSGTSKTSLRDVTFSGNQAGSSGGAMFNNGNLGESSPDLLDVTFSGNYADSYGGAMRNYGQSGISHPSLSYVTFFDNHADNGGAIASHGSIGASNPSLDYVTFTANSASTLGGAMYNHSGSGVSSPMLTNVIFTGNQATSGGAMYNDGEGGNSSPGLTRVTFTGNSANSAGGALYNNGAYGDSSPSLVNSSFSGNHASSGGAIYNFGIDGTNSSTLVNVTFSGNSAASYGGAMYNAISSPNLTNITFSGNTSDYICGALYYDTSTTSLDNLILWGNMADTAGSQLCILDSTITITSSLLQGGLSGDGVFKSGSTLNDGGGNLDADPHFLRDPDPGPDGNWDGVDDDYGDLHLGSTSPAIDTGTNTAVSLPADLDGQPRVVDGDGDGTATVDMGAYEYNCPAGELLYVDHTASGFGGSWLDAKPDLALGLHLAGYCPGVSQVWVATGVYTPGTARTDSFNLVPGVAIYGGFDPAGGADDFSERNWETHPAVLSGDIAGDDVNTNGVVLTTTHIVGDNSYHVVRADGSSTPITSTTLLDGFTITAGQADNSSPNSSGAGMYLEYSSPTLENIKVLGNFAMNSGAGVYNNHSHPSFFYVLISGNSADIHGGGMANNDSNPSLVNTVISGNAAYIEGGGMKNWGSSPSLINVLISGNSAGDDGGGIYNSPGSTPVLTNVTVSGNSADDSGGGIGNSNSGSIVYNSILWNNRDSSGTGTITATIYNRGGTITLTHSLAQGTGGTASWTSDPSFIDGGDNLDADPLFIQDIDPSSAPATAGNLHLQFDSPAVDKGENNYIVAFSTDLDGSLRVVDGDLNGTAIVDMGAYEFQIYTLVVTLAGSGSGTVTGNGISCSSSDPGSDCSEIFPENTLLTLTASADPSSTFAGWSGACNHTDPVCTVAMVDARAVTATFDIADVLLPLVFR